MRHGVAGPIALVMISTMVSLLLIEISLRAYGIEGTAPRIAARLKIYEFHPELGWWPPAQRSYYRSDDFYGHFNYYNPARMPVTEDVLDVAPDPAVSSIAFIGDSFVEGYYVPSEKSFVHLVSAAFPDYQTLNLGVSGYGPAQYLLRARMELPKYNVAHIVVGFLPYNDVPYLDYPYMLEGRYAKPVFGADLTAPVNTPLEKREGVEPGVTILHKVLRKLAIYSVVRPVYKRITRYFGSGVDGRPDPKRLDTDPKDYAKALRLIAAIREIDPTARFTIAYIPTFQQLVSPEMFARDRALFRENCAALQIDCYIPQFVEEPAESLEPYYIGPKAAEGHFSELGSRKFADFLIGVLRSKLDGPAQNDNGQPDRPG
jgi:hypothetical protein